MSLRGLTGRVAIVAGGATGIGATTAVRLGAEGCHVVVGDIDIDGARRTADRICEAGGYAHPVAFDLSEPESVAVLVDSAGDTFGGVDFLFTVGADMGALRSDTDVVDIDLDVWDRVMAVNLRGYVAAMKYVIPKLLARGGGAIVNMSSAAGRHGYAFRTPYSAAKFGVIGFTQSLAKELGPHNIRVNAILPGVVEGPRIEAVIRARAGQLGISYEEMEKDYLQKVSLRRMVSPHDVAAMVLFLLSPMGDNLSGQSIGVCGNFESYRAPRTVAA